MSVAAVAAWGLAERQIAQEIANLSGLTIDSDFFVGDEADIEGRINCGVFSITGGREQDQGYQSGATAWHSEGTVFAVFVKRADATTFASAFLDEDRVPFEGATTDPVLPQVSKVYLRSMPTITRREVPISGRKSPIRAAVVSVTLGVVFQE